MLFETWSNILTWASLKTGSLYKLTLSMYFKALPIHRRNTSVLILIDAFISPFCVWSILTTIWMMKTRVKTLAKHIWAKVAKPWHPQGVRVQQSKLLLIYLWLGDVFSVLVCVVRPVSKELLLEKALQRCAWRHLNCTCKFYNWWKQRQSSMGKWFLQLPPEYYLTAPDFVFFLQNSFD